MHTHTCIYVCVYTHMCTHVCTHMFTYSLFFFPPVNWRTGLTDLLVAGLSLFPIVPGV